MDALTALGCCRWIVGVLFSFTQGCGAKSTRLNPGLGLRQSDLRSEKLHCDSLAHIMAYLWVKPWMRPLLLKSLHPGSGNDRSIKTRTQTARPGYIITLLLSSSAKMPGVASLSPFRFHGSYGLKICDPKFFRPFLTFP